MGRGVEAGGLMAVPGREPEASSGASESVKLVSKALTFYYRTARRDIGGRTFCTATVGSSFTSASRFGAFFVPLGGFLAQFLLPLVTCRGGALERLGCLRHRRAGARPLGRMFVAALDGRRRVPNIRG